MAFIHIVSTLFVAAIVLAFALSYRESIRNNVSVKRSFIDNLLMILETLGVIIIIVSVSIELTDIINYGLDKFLGFLYV